MSDVLIDRVAMRPASIAIMEQVALLATLALVVACDAKQPVPVAKTTSLSGQVFVQPESGMLIKAAGRTVTIVRPDSQAIQRAAIACQRADKRDDAIADRMSGKRRPGPQELSIEQQLRLHGEMLTSEVRRAYESSRKTVSTQTTDIEGRFTFPELAAGEYVATTSHEEDGHRYSWTALFRAKQNVANSLILGSDAASWVGLCGKVFEIESTFRQ